MACSSCNKSLQATNESTKEINLSSLSNIPQDRLISLYQQGYRIPILNTSISSNVKSLDVVSSTEGILKLGLLIIGGYYAYKYYDTHIKK